MPNEAQKVALSVRPNEDGRDDWWAECLFCAWVSSSNSDRRAAEQKFGRHYQNDHLQDAK